MKHVMVDLETLGTEANSAILSIGAVWFDPHGEEFKIDPTSVGTDPEDGRTYPYDLFSLCFERTVDIQSCVNAGMSVSGATLQWWMKQGEEPRKRAFGGETMIREALNDLTDFIVMVSTDYPNGSPMSDVCVWGNGSDFDNAILQTAYARHGYATPWHFWNNRCYRTFKALAKDLVKVDPELVRVGDAHNALDDAITQALHMQRVNAALRDLAPIVFMPAKEAA